jgi:hypothetical protein
LGLKRQAGSQPLGYVSEHGNVLRLYVLLVLLHVDWNRLLTFDLVTFQI